MTDKEKIDLTDRIISNAESLGDMDTTKGARAVLNVVQLILNEGNE